MARFSNWMKALQFHRITPEFQFCGTWNTPEQFARFLEIISDKDVDIVLPGENDDGIVITFDDGEDTIYEYAFPILKKYSVKAVVFLIVNYIGQNNLWDISITGKRVQHLSWDKIYEMKDWGIEFGSHTMNHRNLARMSEQEVEYEVFESRRILQQELGECRSISYPFNRVNPIVVRAVSKAGYEFGFGGDGRNDLLLKKESVYITDTPRSFETKVLEKPGLIYRYDRIKQKVINYFTIATMLAKR